MIVGLPGSGKTTLANEMVGKVENVLLIDDMSLNLNKCSEFLWFKHSCLIITDPYLCGVPEHKMRDKINDTFTGDFYFDFHFIYFENDLAACMANAARAPKPGGTDNFSKHLSRTYTIPLNADVRKVWKPVDNL